MFQLVHLYFLCCSNQDCHKVGPWALLHNQQDPTADYLDNIWKTIWQLDNKTNNLINKNANLTSLETSIEDKTGIKVFIKNKKNNAGSVTFEYKDLDQLNRLIMVIKANY